MRPLSPLTDRISGPSAKAWAVGDDAYDRMRNGQQIIHLGVGDPDLDTPAHIQAALVSALEAGRTHYAPLAGEPALRDAIAAHGSALYGGEIDSGRVAVLSGAQGALFSVFLTIAGPGDEVIVLEPSYATYPAVAQIGGAKMVPVVLDKDTGYQLDLVRIEAAITDRTVAILVNSPGNPSGTVFAQDDLNALARLCQKRGIWLVSDEVYWSLCYDGAHSSPYRQVETRDSVIVVNSLSKSHAMTGWRIGWVIAPAPVIAALTDLAQAQYFGINQFVQEAAATALNDSDTPQRISEIFKARRDAFVAALSKTNTLSFSVPQGGMFLLIDVSETGLDGKAFAERLLDAENVAVVPGFGFGASMKDTVRVGFLSDIPVMEEAARRIIRFAEELRNG
ncbi:pyridoxal phosphate-dependent aminotransferase [Paracoccus sp. S1E-3]|uniref:pyridoxal phosphate-dependent aminotransferase n=1 Tax=Paracoccus sp. S1E-3 TaxID=2756130 RepID=UPI0015EF2ED6|nr:aminotransferase class I/II-fold pyridoxal phosphate-dependent enzyme [Paracoccus sp. S1E-3]MBA4491476.1 aminotransferase class I/II-fold pyridoxal phosphate-dependent enzyme [Paracoccus sp. S1E-3]